MKEEFLKEEYIAQKEICVRKNGNNSVYDFILHVYLR